MRSPAILLILTILTPSAFAHDQWANGTSIPSWVKASCCGPADAHHLTPEQVHGPMTWGEAYALLGQPDLTSTTDSNIRVYIVDGYRRPIPTAQALPSQDGNYWIFYRDDGGAQSGVYCFFVPMAF